MTQTRTAKQFLSENARNVELLVFRVTMWAVVIACFVALLLKAIIGKPSSVPVHYFLVGIMLAATLEILLPRISSRIGEVSFGGVKVVLAQSEKALDDLLSAFEGPEESPDFEGEGLTDSQKYNYERLSLKLYRIFDQVKDPQTLDFESRNNYRKMIDYVGRAAFLKDHQTKYLRIVMHFQSFRDLTWDEEFLLGHAYLTAADKLPTENARRGYWETSGAYFESASKKNSSAAKIPYHWGLAALSLGNFEKGIELMTRCRAMSQSLVDLADWNIACALKKQNKKAESLNKLRAIPASKLWLDQKDDEWLRDSSDPDFERQFSELCQLKITEYSATLT